MNHKAHLIVGSVLVILMASLMVTPLAKGQAVEKAEKRIATSGKATTWIKPDRARIFLGIETMNPILDVAREENAKKVNQVLDAIRALKIKGMLIKAPSLNISLVKEEQHRATREGRLPKIIGYRVRQDFTVLLKDDDPKVLSKDAGIVIDAALKNGVNLLQQVVFFKEDDSKQRRKTLALAVENAIANAQAMAKAAGVSIDEYTQISSSLVYVPPRRPEFRMRQSLSFAEAGGVGTTLVAGELELTCNVNIQCSIK